MSKVNRLKNKLNQARQPNLSSDQIHEHSKPKIHSIEKEQQYESYEQLSQCNPNGVTSTCVIFPHSSDLQSQFNIPLGILLSPVLFLQNQNAQVMNKSAQRVPKCQTCRAYINCYCKIQKNTWICFLCGRSNQKSKNYDAQQLPNNQLNSSIYQTLGNQNFYSEIPQEQVFIFLIDTCPDAYHSKMLYYAAAAMKEVLVRPQVDDVQIYFYTYDQILHEYDFSGQQIKCTILDQTIVGQQLTQIHKYFIKDVRDKLFLILDTLEEISQNNHRISSNFQQVFDYIFQALKHTQGKFFVFQANQAICNEKFLRQQPSSKTTSNMPKSLFESKNSTCLNKYTPQVMKNECCFSFFIFSKLYKTIKTIHDMLKLSNSQLKVYRKDNDTDLNKFYYDLTYLLAANYFKKVRVQFIIKNGWHFTAVYGNIYKTKEHITYQINSIQPSRKIFVMVNPTKGIQNPYFSLQMITNYVYKKQHFMSVATIVQPVSGYIQKIFESIVPHNTIACIGRTVISSMRIDPVLVARKKCTDFAASIYQSAIKFFKKQDQIPDSLLNVLMAFLSVLKSVHTQPQLIDNTPTMDLVCGQRNTLQFSGVSEIANYLMPYLFDLSQLDQSMCRQNTQFIYPPTIQVSFSNTRSGLFLMDCGICLYLFIAKQCDPSLLQDLFGIQKIGKGTILSENMLSQQATLVSQQVQTLIKFLRQQINAYLDKNHMVGSLYTQYVVAKEVLTKGTSTCTFILKNMSSIKCST